MSCIICNCIVHRGWKWKSIGNMVIIFKVRMCVFPSTNPSVSIIGCIKLKVKSTILLSLVKSTHVYELKVLVWVFQAQHTPNMPTLTKCIDKTLVDFPLYHFVELWMQNLHMMLHCTNTRQKILGILKLPCLS